MLPPLTDKTSIPKQYLAYLQELAQRSFAGDISTDLAARITMATDNGIYQVLPTAVVFPKNKADIQLLLSLANLPAYREIQFTPRGGGTGTAGHAINDGIIVDTSRYFRKILEINLKEGWVRVQPGVVLDQLNATLKSHGVFFAPNLSPSNRATLGGMFNTDACGKGSCLYGRTSQHILASESILSDGTVLVSEKLPQLAWQNLCQTPGIIGQIYQTLADTIVAKQVEIREKLPKLTRLITGYNLREAYDVDDQSVNVNYLLSGAEGTLAVTTELKLKLTPIPKAKMLVAIKYREFSDALQAARLLLSIQPAAIETIDDKILAVARFDEIYIRVKPLLDPHGNDDYTKAVNLVEFIGENQAELSLCAQALLDSLEKTKNQLNKNCGYYVTSEHHEMEALWDLRKKSVGLLANLAGNRRPIPFIEDTAVPPEKLADFVAELRTLLDKYHLSYGMFGHVDAGCLHVRPSLDMTDAYDASLVPIITKAVHDLVRKYGGVLWSEHGAGFRSQYIPDYFGSLYSDLQKIKTAFDPYNQLNPGKIVSSLNKESPIFKIEPGHYRGEYDRQIPPSVREQFSKAIECNGNGQCFTYQTNEVMCPSFKVTQDRIHSPKGRMALLREWLRLATHAGLDFQQTPKSKMSLLKGIRLPQNKDDFNRQVYEAMAGCLGCKACASSCPVKVDVPHLRAKFLAHYYTSYPRKWRDYVLSKSEIISNWQAAWPRLAKMLNPISKTVLHLLGLRDLPKLPKQSLNTFLKSREIPTLSLEQLAHLSPDERVKTVAIVQDTLTSTYEPRILLSLYDFLSYLGYRVYLLPRRINGKVQHHLGFLDQFEQIVFENEAYYQEITAAGIALLGIEPSLTLCYRDEYAKALKRTPRFNVLLLQEWITQQIPVAKASITSEPYWLFAHCTEKALITEAERLWQSLFAHFGLNLQIISVGCCGMAGSYGHYHEQQAHSKGIYQLSWEEQIEKLPADRILVTGFSCRSQVKRFSKFIPKHPIEILAEKVSL